MLKIITVKMDHFPLEPREVARKEVWFLFGFLPVFKTETRYV